MNKSKEEEKRREFLTVVKKTTKMTTRQILKMKTMRKVWNQIKTRAIRILNRKIIISLMMKTNTNQQ